MGGDVKTLVKEEAGSCANTDLGHVGGPANLDVPAANHHPVHLLQGQLGCLRHLVLHEGKPAGQGAITITAQHLPAAAQHKLADTYPSI